MLLFIAAATLSRAQTKVFKAVSGEISSQMKTIWQDGTLVGYLVFTELEKASADSFNYKITIMDENLNDIGTVNFREEKLMLQAVAFEQDILCLAYLKSNIIGKEFRNAKEYRAALPNARSDIFTQFLNLNGKIIKSNTVKAELGRSTDYLPGTSGHPTAIGKLHQQIQLRNIPQQGFACFYADDSRSGILFYNTAGKSTWWKPVPYDAKSYLLFTSGQYAYMLIKRDEKIGEGGFELMGFNTRDSSVIPRYVLKDKQGNSLRPLRLDNDPVTGKPYISGYIVSPDHENARTTGGQFSRGAYCGLFTVNLNGPKKNDIQEIFSYWGKGSLAGISRKGFMRESDAYPHFTESFRDYQGNTYFAGSNIQRRVRWVAIGISAITLPLIYPPVGLVGSGGIYKCKKKDVVLLRQDAKGAFSFEKSIPAEYSKFWEGKYPLDVIDNRSFLSVQNPDTKTNYLVVDDDRSTLIYNVTQKKIVRTIAHQTKHQDGDIVTAVFSAKEGHIMVSEFNKKERSVRYSIEAL